MRISEINNYKYCAVNVIVLILYSLFCLKSTGPTTRSDLNKFLLLYICLLCLNKRTYDVFSVNEDGLFDVASLIFALGRHPKHSKASLDLFKEFPSRQEPKEATSVIPKFTAFIFIYFY